MNETKSANERAAIEKIVIVRLYGLGNFILALPLIEAVERLLPRAELTLLLDPRCRRIAELARPQSRLVILEKDFDAPAWFAAEKPDLTLFTYPTGQSPLVAAATRFSRVTVSHDVGRNRGLATVALAVDPQRHEVEANLDLLRAAGYAAEMTYPKITLPRAATVAANGLLRAAGVPKNFVALHPGCHGDLAVKRWPPAYYAAVADALAADGLGVVLVGGPDEAEVAGEVARAATAPTFNLAGKTSLPAVAAVLKKARLIVANDSGLMHLAAAVGTPVVGIYGPTSWEKNTPQVDPHRIVRRPVSCSPCYLPGKVFAPRRAWCLDMTTPDQVLGAARSLLGREPWENKPPHQPFVSVIVPTYNGGKKIGRLLTSLEKQTYPRDRFEVLIVDNGSRDDTAQVVRSFPGVRYAYFDRIQTSYAARNHGLSLARGEVLAFTDDDCQADPDWLRAGAEWFEHPEIGAVAGRLFGAESDSEIARWQSRRQILNWQAAIENAPNPPIITANVFFRRAVFDQLGKFKERMISGGDHDMAWRMIASGRWQARGNERAVVYHYHRETLQSLFRVFVRYGYGHVDIDRTFPVNQDPPARRLREGLAGWRALAAKGLEFARDGIAPPDAKGLRPVRPADFLATQTGRALLITVPALEAHAFVQEARRSGADVLVLPLPPAIEYLDGALLSLADEQPRELYVYAAGQHTRRLVTRPSFSDLPIRGIIDDRATPGQQLDRYPVVTLSEARRRGCRSILISTDAFEAELLKKLAPLEKEGIRIFGLYDAKVLTRLARHVVRERAAKTADPIAVFLPNDVVSPAHAAAVAEGAGARLAVSDLGEIRYSDDFLDWVSTVGWRLGRILGSVRFRHLLV